jgi:hypothetical protein
MLVIAARSLHSGLLSALWKRAMSELELGSVEPDRVCPFPWENRLRDHRPTDQIYRNDISQR